jgi:hypothetical protein
MHLPAGKVFFFSLLKKTVCVRFNPNDFTLGLKTGFIFPSLLILLTTSSQTNPPRASVNEYNPVFSRWSPPVGAFKSFLCSIVQSCLNEYPNHFISTSEFHEKVNLGFLNKHKKL